MSPRREHASYPHAFRLDLDHMTETRPKRRPWVMRALAIATIIAVPALLLGVNHLLSREFVEIRELRQAVDQSYSTRAQLMRLLSLHQDLETGQRGYVLTGRSMFLAPYDRAHQAIPAAFTQLEAGLAPGSPVRRRLADLRRASAEKIRFVTRDIALSREGRADRSGHWSRLARVCARWIAFALLLPIWTALRRLNSNSAKL